MGRFFRLFALCLSLLTVLGLFAACAGESPETTGSAPTNETTKPTEPQPTQSPEEAKVMKILTLGHSLTVDSCHMLNLVCATEGIGEYEEIVIGTLYYSGCSLGQHVQFMLADSPVYNLYLSSTKTPDAPPTIQKSVTARDGIVSDEWDIIILQGKPTELTTGVAYTEKRVQTIQNYVNKYKTNPTAVFAWHMPWVTPVDNELRDTYPYDPNPYYSLYEPYNHQRAPLYNAYVTKTNEYVTPDKTFQFLIPSGTSIENALSSYLEEKDLHRDYAHATDYGRLIAAYTWYCRLMGIEKLDAIKLDVIPKAFFKSTKGSEDRPLTDMEKAIALEAINNALKNPFAVTQSQYTTAPAQ